MQPQPDEWGPLTLSTQVEHWRLASPFRITGRVWEVIDVLRITLEASGAVGQGESTGVYYRNETPWSIQQQIERVRASIEKGIGRDALQRLLPPGGARSAVDNALWDLEAKLSGRPVWQIAGLPAPRALYTTFTCGADTPRNMAAAVLNYRDARAIKVKLTGDADDGDRVRAVREAVPSVWLAVDANQGFTQRSLEKLMPTLIAARVQLIEQPFRIGQ
jgi:L-Ala-D/L-Glu epimerase